MNRDTGVLFDATEVDYWTCHRVKCAGVWTTDEFAEDTGRHFGIWYPIRCQAINDNRRSACRRCGFPRPQEAAA